MDQQAAGSQVSRPRSYTEEYKRQVVDPVVSTGRTASVAAELGIHHTLLSRWVRRYGQLAGSEVDRTNAPRSGTGLPTGKGPSAARQRRMVRYGQLEPEQAQQASREPCRLAQGKSEDEPERQHEV